MLSLSNVKKFLLKDSYETLNIQIPQEEWNEFILNLEENGFNNTSFLHSRLENDKGPYAFFVREIGLIKIENAFNVDYLNQPEFMTDILKKIKSKFNLDYEEDYKRKSTMCIIEFKQLLELNHKESDYCYLTYLNTSILYLWMIYEFESFYKCAYFENYLNTSFCNNGEVIAPNNICNIELLSEDDRLFL